MSDHKKTVVISGAAGFIGSHLVRALVRQGYTLLVLTNRREIQCSNGNVIPCNFSENRDEAERLFQKYSPQGVIHLATCFAPTHTAEQIPEMISSNITFGVRLLDSAVKAEIPWFLNIGTFWQHFNGAEYDPVNFYAATKQAFESIAAFYSKTSAIRFVTLCLNDTYGSNDTRKKIFPLWKHLSEHPEESLAMSPGEQLLDILHVDDVVSGIFHLMQMLESHSPEIADSDRFYLTSGDLLSLRQAADLFAEIAGKPLNIRWGERPYRNREVMHPQCSGKPLPGWQSKISLSEGIRKYLYEE